MLFSADDLKEWLVKHDAEKRCHDSFWLSLKNYKTEEPEEYQEYFPNFDPSKLVLKVESVSISYLNYPDLNYNHVRVYMPIRYPDKKIGYYELWFAFDGTVEDDYFVLD